VRVRPVDEIVTIRGWKDWGGMVERALRRDWVTRFGGDMVNPLSGENLGVPPSGFD